MARRDMPLPDGKGVVLAIEVCTLCEERPERWGWCTFCKRLFCSVLCVDVHACPPREEALATPVDAPIYTRRPRR